jgi:hypothetical protein
MTIKYELQSFFCLFFYCHYDYCLDYDWYFLGGKFQNDHSFSTTQNVYLCTTALMLFIHVGFLEYLSFKQFKLIGRITIRMSQ